MTATADPTDRPLAPTAVTLPDGVVVVVKRDCPTCVMVAPVLAEMDASLDDLIVWSQDDPTFPETIADPVDDTTLDRSYIAGIETVPTLLVRRDGHEIGRVEGWDRAEWAALSGVADLGRDLPEFRPGCGSLSVDPAHVAALRVRPCRSTGL